MKRINLAAGLAFALFLANLMLYLYQPLGENFYIIGDSLVTILALLTVLAGFYAFRLHGFRSTQGKALFFMAAGVFFWFLGELTWGIYEIVLAETPVASIADLFWFIGYPMFLMGLYYIFRIPSSMPSRRRLAILVPAVVLVFSLMVYLALPTLAASISAEEKMATAGYVIGDAFVLAGIMFAIACLWGSRFAKPWGIIFLSMAVLTIADIFYSSFFSVYETGNLIDILWNTGYMFFTFGFIYHRETVKDIVHAAKEKKANG
jgi:hypothetical protein